MKKFLLLQRGGIFLCQCRSDCLSDSFVDFCVLFFRNLCQLLVVFVVDLVQFGLEVLYGLVVVFQ